jgi:hypothetical protein
MKWQDCKTNPPNKKGWYKVIYHIPENEMTENDYYFSNNSKNWTFEKNKEFKNTRGKDFKMIRTFGIMSDKRKNEMNNWNTKVLGSRTVMDNGCWNGWRVDLQKYFIKWKPVNVFERIYILWKCLTVKYYNGTSY